MRLILDTHAAIWLLRGDRRLPRAVRAEIAAGGNEVLLSAAVAWEVAIKQSIGKLRLPSPFGPTLVALGALPLPVTLDHAAAVAELPLHHRDPFDRMLVAQARLERAVLVTGDERMLAYGVPVLW